MSDGKSAVSSAITSMGVSTAADASYDTMKNNILNIEPTISGSWSKNKYTAKAKINGKNEVSTETIIRIMDDFMCYNSCGITSVTYPTANIFNNNIEPDSNKMYFFVSLGNRKGEQVYLNSVNNYILIPADKFGDAEKDNILSGKTATTKEGLKISGTMPDKGAVNKTIGCSQSYTIPKGYHNGSGKVTTRSLTYETSDGFPKSNIKQLFPPSIKVYTRGELVEGEVSTTYIAEAWYYIIAAPNPYTEWTNINTKATIFFNEGSDWGTNHRSSSIISGEYIFQADSVALERIFLYVEEPRINLLVESSDNLNYIKGYNIIHLVPKGAIYLYSPYWAVGKNRAVFIYSKLWTRDNFNDNKYHYLYNTTSCILVADPTRIYSFKVYIDSECTTEIELNIQFNAETGVLCVYNTSDRYLMNDIWIQKVN